MPTPPLYVPIVVSHTSISFQVFLFCSSTPTPRDLITMDLGSLRTLYQMLGAHTSRCELRKSKENNKRTRKCDGCARACVEWKKNNFMFGFHSKSNRELHIVIIRNNEEIIQQIVLAYIRRHSWLFNTTKWNIQNDLAMKLHVGLSSSGSRCRR